MAESRSGAPLRVAVVDDDPEMAEAVKMMLKLKGVDVLEADSGVTGYLLIKRELPDVVLLDVMMPDIDGYEVCRKLKLNPSTKDIPIIFVTAKTGQDHMDRGLSLGAQGYITKPFGPGDLIDKITKVTSGGA